MFPFQHGVALCSSRLSAVAAIWQTNLCGTVGWYRNRKSNRVIFSHPTTFNFAIDTGVSRLGVSEMPTWGRNHTEVVFVLYLDTTHRIEYPLEYRTFGIVV